MGVPGETDLSKMLASLDVERRPGVFTYVEVAVPTAVLLGAAHAMVREEVYEGASEGEMTTLVLPIEAAREAGHRIEIELAWLTLTVQSSLAAVGLTAVFSARLGERGIACNVLAGYRHDHILVPLDRVSDAIVALQPLTPS